MSCAAGADEARLRAIRAHMRRVPRDVIAAVPVRMAEHRLVVGAVRGPVVAGGVEARRKCTPIGIRAREHVVLVRHVADAFDQPALLIERVGLLHVVAVPELIALQIADVRCDQRALRIVPGSRPDAIARIDRGLVALLLLTKIRVPRMSAGAHRLGDVLASPVGSREPAEVAGTRYRRGDKERHRVLRTLLSLALSQNGSGAQKRHRDGGNNQLSSLHDRASFASLMTLTTAQRCPTGGQLCPIAYTSV